MSAAPEREAVPRFYLRNLLSAVTDAHLREATIDLFDDAITQAACHEIDICVLATCRVSNLYYMLVEGGLPKISCRVIPGRDFTLQIRQEEWAGKRVLVLDDTIFLGSSLAFIVRELRELVRDGQVSVHAICADGKRSSRALLQYSKVSYALKKDTVASQQFSLELTAALHQALLPPMGDYFSSVRLDLSSGRLDEILGAEGWIRADVTCPVIASAGAFSYSLFPRQEARRSIETGLNAIIPKISDFIAIAKMRAYGKIQGDRAQVRFIPILILKPFNAEIVSNALNELKERLGLRSDVPVDKWAWEAQYRILQLVLSAVVAREFHYTIDRKEGEFQDLAKRIVDTRALRANFGATLAKIASSAVESILESDTRSQLSLPIGELVDDDAIPGVFMAQKEFVNSILKNAHERLHHAVDIPSRIGKTEVIRTGNDLVSEIADIFGAIHNKLELPEEAEIRKLSVEQFFADYPKRDQRTLSLGVSLSSLAKLVPDHKGDLDRFELVSLTLDVCLDLGIIAPSTTYIPSRKAAVRLYHLGENSFLPTMGCTFTYYLTTVATSSQVDALAETVA